MSKSTYVLEPLLRPAVEWQSATVAGACAGVALGAPWALMLPQSLGVIAAAIAAGFGVVRAREALDVQRYQAGMRYYKVSSIAPHKIPRTPGTLYLGQGFEWTQKHTQRRLDASRPESAEFITISGRRRKLEALARKCEGWAKTRSASGKPAVPGLEVLTRVTASEHWLNPVRPIHDLGGTPILHGVEPKEKPILMRQSERNGHLLVLGTTRVGKTRLLELLCTQDIHDGYVVIIIDPKGDAELMMRVYAEASRAGRLDQLYLFHLGYPEFSARYNGIGSFSRITEVATRATNALPSSGNSAAFKEFSWRFTNLVAQGQVALGEVPTYDGLLRHITDIEPLFIKYARLSLQRARVGRQIGDWESELAQLQVAIQKKGVPLPRSLLDRSPEVAGMVLLAKKFQAKLVDPVLGGLATAVSYEKSFFEKIIASLGPFLEKLTTGAVGKLISPSYFDPDDQRPIFNWQQVIKQGGIVYAGLDALSDSVIASAVGNSMLADLVSVGGQLYKTGLEPHRDDGKIVLPTICGHFDEAEAIVGAEFVPMVNRMGGAGMRVTAYTQSPSDLQAKLGDEAKAQQIVDNFNHVITMRLRSAKSAKFIVDQLPKVEVATLTVVSGVTDKAAEGDGIHFVSNNQDRVATKDVPMIDVADIMQLPKGNAFALIEGNRLQKIRIPFPDAKGDVHIPPSLRAVCEDMKAKYRTGENWATQTDWLSGWLQDHPIGTNAPGPVVLVDAGSGEPGSEEFESTERESAGTEGDGEGNEDSSLTDDSSDRTVA